LSQPSPFGVPVHPFRFPEDRSTQPGRPGSRPRYELGVERIAMLVADLVDVRTPSNRCVFKIDILPSELPNRRSAVAGELEQTHK
jgi:hypothetical protein